MKKLFLQLIRFGIVGVIALLIDVGVLMLLKEIVRLDVMLSSALSFTASVTVNYLLSMLWVFQGKGESRVKEFVIFVSLSIGGLIINQIVMWVGTEYLHRYYLLVKLFALVIVPAYNFVTRKIFLEKKEA